MKKFILIILFLFITNYIFSQTSIYPDSTGIKVLYENEYTYQADRLNNGSIELYNRTNKWINQTKIHKHTGDFPDENTPDLESNEWKKQTDILYSILEESYSSEEKEKIKEIGWGGECTIELYINPETGKVDDVRFSFFRLSYPLSRRELGNQAPEELNVFIVQLFHQCCGLFDHLFFFHIAPPLGGEALREGLSCFTPYDVILAFPTCRKPLFSVDNRNYVWFRNFLAASRPRTKSATISSSRSLSSGSFFSIASIPSCLLILIPTPFPSIEHIGSPPLLPNFKFYEPPQVKEIFVLHLFHFSCYKVDHILPFFRSHHFSLLLSF